MDITLKKSGVLPYSKTYHFTAIMVIIAIFSREIGKGSLGGLDIDWISYPIYVAFFFVLILTQRWVLDKFLVYFFSLLLLSGLFSKFFLGLSLLPFFKQFLPIVLIYTIVSYVIKRNHIQYLFELYVRGAVISAVLGIIQLILKLVGIRFLTEFTWLNIDSVAEEPSHYAAILLPAVVYTLIHIKRFRGEFFLLFLTLVFTFNLTAYAVFGLMVIIIFRKIYYLLLVLPVLTAMGIYIYNLDPLIKFRVNETVKFLITQDLKNTHGTPLSFFSNLQVALYTIKLNPLWGSGLGGHEEMYYRYFTDHPFSYLDYLFGLNAKSAHSLSIRVLSEIGLLGLALFVFNLFKPFFIKSQTVYYGIALAGLSHFLCKTLKLGNYFDLGTPFFFLMIVYAYKEYKISRYRV